MAQFFFGAGDGNDYRFVTDGRDEPSEGDLPTPATRSINYLHTQITQSKRGNFFTRLGQTDLLASHCGYAPKDSHLAPNGFTLNRELIILSLLNFIKGRTLAAAINTNQFPDPLGNSVESGCLLNAFK